MPESAYRTYRRLGGRRWLRWQSDDGWLAADHLLVVKTRFFSEQYVRVYWNDVQALLLYRLAHNSGLMLGAEVVVVAAAAAVAYVQNRFEAMALAFCYVTLYLAWRLTRRNYGVELTTRTADVRIPLTTFRSSARLLVDQLQQAVEKVQGRLAAEWEALAATDKRDSEPDAAGAIEGPVRPEPVMINIIVSGGERPRKPILVLHGIVFALGLTTWLFTSGVLQSGPMWIATGTFLSLLFFVGLSATFFLQQDPEFPFAVRCAAVMNLALTAAMVGPVVALGTRFDLAGLSSTVGTLRAPATLLRLLACLFGLMGIYKSSLDESDKPSARSGPRANPLA